MVFWNDFRVVDEKNTFANISSGDLRISILSQCNMNCFYCHAEGYKSDSELSCEEIIYIIEKSMPYGVKQLRITGGEPLLHKDIIHICEEIRCRFPNLNVGINTNGIEIAKIEQLIEKRLIDRVVFGIDYFDSRVSKASQYGLSSKKIMQNILRAKEMGCVVEVDSVYDGNYENILKMSEWCLKNRIRLKILEIIDDELAPLPSKAYVDMINKLTADLPVRIGVNNSFNDLFALDENNTEISFFHSLCRTKECHRCARMHMRVTSRGYAKPCLKNMDTEYPLLSGDFDSNMRKAIYALGVSPNMEG